MQIQLATPTAYPPPPALPAGSLQQLLDRRGEFRSVFQPIRALLGGHTLGYEALLRLPQGAPFSGPCAVFEAATRTGQLVELEFAALEAHLRAIGTFREGRLFLNFSAEAFLDPRMDSRLLARRIRDAGLAPERVVLELTELLHLPDPAGFAAALRPLREERFLLAVDDFGCGFTNLRMLVDLGPDFVKVDRSLVTGLAQHSRKRIFLETIAALGRRINCAVIAEGVETAEDLAGVQACGITGGQGWYLGRPGPIPARDEETLTPALTVTAVPEETVGSFAMPVEGIAPETRVGEVVWRFERGTRCEAIPVLSQDRALGLVTRSLLFFHLGHRYGYSLWCDRPVSEFLARLGGGDDRIPASASLEEAAEEVQRRPAWRRFDPLIVEAGGHGYHGLLPVDRLLGEITRLKVEYALQSNPLTGLPGSLVLAQASESRLATGRAFALGWVDIDDFKPFNDRYGFGRGDEVLQLLAGVLKAHLLRCPGDLLTHLGGDDFAFLTETAVAESRSLAAVREFGERVVGLYDPADRAAGGIVSVDRKGRTRRFGLMSVSVGIVIWRGDNIGYRLLVEIAAEVKSAAKRKAGSTVMVNARALGQPTPVSETARLTTA